MKPLPNWWNVISARRSWTAWPIRCCPGVYGGDAAKLSARAVLPRFVEMEEKYGSLSRAMLAAHKKMAQARSKQPARPLFTSLKDGMQQMVDAILGRLDPESIRLRNHVLRVYPEDGGWRVSIEMNGDERYDAVILATPANVAGTLLDGVDRGLARDLLDITYSSSVTVTLGYYMDQLKRLPPGFGFLVPRSEGTRMLACTFVHNKFPHRAPEGKGILRCFLGGARDEAVLALTDEEMLETVHRELKDIVKLDARPMFARMYRWRGAMAQYEPGHIARVATHREASIGDSRPGDCRQCLSRHRSARLHPFGHGSGERSGAGAGRIAANPTIISVPHITHTSAQDHRRKGPERRTVKTVTCHADRSEVTHVHRSHCHLLPDRRSVDLWPDVQPRASRGQAA